MPTKHSRNKGYVTCPRLAMWGKSPTSRKIRTLARQTVNKVVETQDPAKVERSVERFAEKFGAGGFWFCKTGVVAI